MFSLATCHSTIFCLGRVHWQQWSPRILIIDCFRHTKLSQKGGVDSNDNHFHLHTFGPRLTMALVIDLSGPHSLTQSRLVPCSLLIAPSLWSHPKENRPSCTAGFRSQSFTSPHVLDFSVVIATTKCSGSWQTLGADRRSPTHSGNCHIRLCAKRVSEMVDVLKLSCTIEW